MRHIASYNSSTLLSLLFYCQKNVPAIRKKAAGTAVGRCLPICLWGRLRVGAEGEGAGFEPFAELGEVGAVGGDFVGHDRLAHGDVHLGAALAPYFRRQAQRAQLPAHLAEEVEQEAVGAVEEDGYDGHLELRDEAYHHGLPGVVFKPAVAVDDADGSGGEEMGPMAVMRFRIMFTITL